MGFTELSHAFIAAKYYVYLKEIFGDRGEAAFLHATRYYGEQRGRRMAQRAIRDGKPLTYETYCQYGEWVNTEEVKAQGLGNQSETTSLSPDFQIHIHVCPWHTQFKNMGLPEAGLLYCKDLDASISEHLRHPSPHIAKFQLQVIVFREKMACEDQHRECRSGGRRQRRTSHSPFHDKNVYIIQDHIGDASADHARHGKPRRTVISDECLKE